MIEFDARILSIIFFILYCVLVLSIMFFISSHTAAAIMLLFPVVMVISFPECCMHFFTYEQANFFNGMVSINNVHILLFIWPVLFGILTYTELVSWYLSPTVKLESIQYKKMWADTSTQSSSINVAFKPIEHLMDNKEKRALDFLSISEGEASELIEIAQNCNDQSDNEHIVINRAT
jgi:hypothetical protein